MSGLPHISAFSGIITVVSQIYIVPEPDQDGRFCIYQIFLLVAHHQAFYVFLSSIVVPSEHQSTYIVGLTVL